MKTENHETLMHKAIALAVKSVSENGGPFGAVIVKNGAIISEGFNQVTQCNDPTAHAEIVAIRKAATLLKTFDLSDCEIYTSCEPCPMCLGAIYWSHIKNIYYSADRHQAAKAGFDDSFIYDEIAISPDKRKAKMIRIAENESSVPFNQWKEKEDKIEY